MITTDPNIGRVLRDRYKLVRLVGQGSMGRVYSADDEALGGVPVAVKFLSQTLLSQRMRTRFEREAKTCAQLGQRSIHIVRVTDYGVDQDDIPFYVMEYLLGENLIDLIRRETLTLPRYLNLTRQICLGLQCAHQGIKIDNEIYPIVHRDIKPSNILVSQDESLGELVKILDFGIAKILQADSSQTGSFMGTLAYASPEQMEGHELDARSDIYSLGVMMYQMLTGKLPLHANTHSFGSWYRMHLYEPPRSFELVNPDVRVPKALENLVMACLEKAPGDRPQSAAEVLKAFAPLEERYGTGRQIARRIEASLSKLPVLPKPTFVDSISGTQAESPHDLSPQEDSSEPKPSSDSANPTILDLSTPSQGSNPTLVTAEEACRTATWPSKMPLAEIVFSRPLSCTDGPISTLWVMLSALEIERRKTCTRYNQFLFMEAPHPMLLWLTVLYNRQYGPRWLPCYLDLKTVQGRQMTRLLGEQGEYRILFFAQDAPQQPPTLQVVSIAAAQCHLLKNWVGVSQASRLPPNPGLSKDHLKRTLETIKPKILMKLERASGDGEELVAG